MINHILIRPQTLLSMTGTDSIMDKLQTTLTMHIYPITHSRLGFLAINKCSCCIGNKAKAGKKQ